MKPRKRSNGIYFVRINGQRVSLGTRDPKQAEINMLKILRGEMKTDVTGRYTLKQALEACYEGHWKRLKDAGGHHDMMQRIIADQGTLAVPGISYEDLEAYVNDLMDPEREPKPCTGSTVDKRLSAINTALDFVCKKKQWIRPTDIPPMPRQGGYRPCPRALTEDEEMDIREVLPRTDAYISALFDFLIDTGARLSEALELKPHHINAREMEVTFVATKNGSGRTVPLTERALAAAQQMMTLTDAHGIPHDVDWCWSRWAKVRDWSGVLVGFHVLRHTCATRLLRRGMDIAKVSRWLGHSSLNVTMVYLQIVANDLKEAAASLKAPPPSTNTAHTATHGTSDSRFTGRFPNDNNVLPFRRTGTDRTVNPLVAGSSPARGANNPKKIR